MPEDAARLEGDITLRDGRVVHMRAIRADDTERLRAFHAGLSIESIIFRFFRVLPELSQDLAERLTHIDYENRLALIALDREEEIIGVVRYDRIAPETAEVAFVVADRWQGHGIATALLYRLAEYARNRGIIKLIAITMASNTRMLEVLRGCGFPCTTHYRDGDIEAHLDISRPPASSFAPCEPSVKPTAQP